MALAKLVALLQALLWYGALALIILLAFRLIFPPQKFRFGTGSFLYRLGRATDLIVIPIRSMLPPGTSATVAVVLSMVAVLMANWICQSVVGGVFQVLYQVSRSLTAGSPLRAIGYLLDGLVLLYTMILLVRILLSWFRIGYYSAGRFIRFIYEMTEPALVRFRGIIPSFGGFDLSPILLFVGLQILRSLIRALFLR